MKYILSLSISACVLALPALAHAQFTELPAGHQYADQYRIMVTNDLRGASRRVGTETTARMQYTDVATDHDAYDAIRYVTSEKILRGTSSRSFNPEGPMSRAELTEAIARRELTDRVVDSCLERVAKRFTVASPVFPDVAAEGYIANGICAAKEANVVHGYPDGYFRGEKQINFVEIAKVVSRGYDASMRSTAPIDGDNWFEKPVQNLDRRKAIPLSVQTFGSRISRAEAAQIIYRLDARNVMKPSKTYLDLMASIGGALVHRVLGGM